MSYTVKGLEKVQARLNMAITGLHSASLNGMIIAAARALRDAQATVPVMTGGLRASAFIEPPKSISLHRPVVVRFGFGMPYSAKTHENIRSGKTGGVSPRGKKYKDWARKGEAFFLRKAINKNFNLMLKDISEGTWTGAKGRPPRLNLGQYAKKGDYKK